MEKSIYSLMLFLFIGSTLTFAQTQNRTSEDCISEEITFIVPDDIPLCDVTEVEITTDSPVDGEWIRIMGFATIENPTSKTTRVSDLIYNNQVVVKWVPTLAECQTLKPGTDDTVVILTKESPKINSITSVENDSNTNKLTADVTGVNVRFDWSTEDGTIESGEGTNEIIVSKNGTYTLKALAQSSGIFTVPCFGEETYKLEGNSQEDYVFNEGFGTGYNSHDLSPATTTYQMSENQGHCPPGKPSDGRYVITANNKLGFSDVCGEFLQEGAVFFQGWHVTLKDHTGVENGRFLIVNAAQDPGQFYKREVSGLTIGNQYTLNAWIANLLNPVTGCAPDSPVNVSMEVYNGDVLMASTTTGDIAAIENVEEVWKEYSLSFSATSADLSIVLRNNAPGGCGNDLAIDDIALRPSQSLGVSKYNSFKVGYEPNPVEDVLTITSEGDIAQIEVYSFSGQNVLSQQASGKSAVVDMSMLTSGVYIVKVYGGTSVETIKVAKQ